MRQKIQRLSNFFFLKFSQKKGNKALPLNERSTKPLSYLYQDHLTSHDLYQTTPNIDESRNFSFDAVIVVF